MMTEPATVATLQKRRLAPLSNWIVFSARVGRETKFFPLRALAENAIFSNSATRKTQKVDR